MKKTMIWTMCIVLCASCALLFGGIRIQDDPYELGQDIASQVRASQNAIQVQSVDTHKVLEYVRRADTHASAFARNMQTKKVEPVNVFFKSSPESGDFDFDQFVSLFEKRFNVSGTESKMINFIYRPVMQGFVSKEALAANQSYSVVLIKKGSSCVLTVSTLELATANRHQVMSITKSNANHDNIVVLAKLQKILSS